MDKYLKLRIAANQVRNRLLELDPINLTHVGQCDLSVDILKDYLSEFEVHKVHGELKHSPRFSSKFWGCQHTWAYTYIDDKKIYIDPTAEQFQSLDPNIPSIYISDIKPSYVLADRDNILYKSKIAKKLNEKYKIGRDGIIEFLQYVIWGRFCDIIRVIKGKGV